MHKLSALVKVKQCGRKIFFPCKNGSQLKSKADLMLTFNKALQKAGVEVKVRFNWV